MSSSRQRVIGNFATLIAANMAGRLVSMASGIYTRRVLGVIAIGQLSWAQAVLSYFSLMINPGLETIAKRDVAQDPKRGTQYVSLLLSLQLALAVLAYMLVGCAALLNIRGPTISILMMLSGVSLLLMPLNLAWLLQAHEKMASVAMVEVLSQVLQLAAVLVLIHAPEHLYRYAVLAYPFRLLVIGYCAWRAAREQLFSWREVRVSLWKSWPLVKEAMPLGFSQAAILLYYNFDAILLGFSRGDEAVGLYSTAYNMMLVALVLSGALSSAYFPSLARAQADLQEQRRVSAEFLRLLVWMGLPIAALNWAVGRHLVELIYGDRFAGSGPLFEWLSLDIALVFFNIGIGWPLNAWGFQKKSFYATIVAAGLNVGLNCLLIPPFGVWPAVATTLLSEVVVMAFLVHWRRQIAPIPLWNIVAKPLLASVVVGGAARVLVESFPGQWMIVMVGGAAGLAISVWMAEKEILCRLWQQYCAGRRAA